MAKTNYFETDNKNFKFDKTLDYPRGTLTKVSDQNPEVVTCDYVLSDTELARIEGGTRKRCSYVKSLFKDDQI